MRTADAREVPEEIERALDLYSERVSTRLVVELGTVSSLDVGRYEMSVRAGASGQGDPSAVPLLYLSSVVGWNPGPAESELAADGLERGIAAALPDTGLRVMGGGQDLIVHRRPRLDAAITMTVTLSDVRLKQGSTQPLIILTVDRKYRDEDGPLIDCRETFLAAPPL